MSSRPAWRRGEASMMTGSGSSIAILQEKFKQLERVREKREEKELLQLFCGHVDNATLFQTSRLQQFARAEVRQPLSLELHCWKKSKHEENIGGLKNISLASPVDSSSIGLIRFGSNHESSEVDTTLHL